MTAEPGKVAEQFNPADVDQILQALCDFEQKRSGDELTPWHFTMRQTWLANDTYLPTLLFHFFTFSKPAIPGLFRKHILGLLISRFKKSGSYGKLASSAHAVQLKLDGNRLRAFFLPGNSTNGLCLKIIPKRQGISQKTRDELEFRQKLTELNCITVPHVEAVEETESFLFVSEELIQGQRYRNRQHSALFINQGIPELCAMYRASGIYFDALDSHYPIAILNDLKSLMGSDKDETEFLKTVENAFRINPDIPIGACHNDLLPSNLCVGNGKLYFFDWEMVSRGPILADLLKLPFKYEKSEELIDAVAKAMFTYFPTATQAYRLQFTVYVAHRIVQNNKKKKQFLKLWNSSQGYFAV